MTEKMENNIRRQVPALEIDTDEDFVIFASELF